MNTGHDLFSANARPGVERHIPVMCREVEASLAPRDGGVYVDGTFGAGGYARAILQSAECSLLGIDSDPEAIRDSVVLSREFPNRLFMVRGWYSEMVHHAAACGLDKVDGIVLDLGVSSMQLDEGRRGFSFLRDGPLDMRMGKYGVSAADIVNQAEEQELANIIFVLGEERRSRAIARAIISSRTKKQIERTTELAAIVSRAVGQRGWSRIHPATKTFQALRAYINRELEELDSGLAAAETLLAAGGKLIVVSFHSLEDRMVKRFFVSMSGKAEGVSRHIPVVPEARPPTFIGGTRVIKPGCEEISINPRARSARMRVGIRTSAASRSRIGDGLTTLPALLPLSVYRWEAVS